jgi:heavy metal translocating P-type ATPase
MPTARDDLEYQAEERLTVPHRRHEYAGIEDRDHDHEHEDADDHQHAAAWIEFARVAVVAVGAALVWFRVWEPFGRLSVIGIVATVVGGWPIFREAYENIVERRMTMELSMSLALFSALAIGEFFTALVITLFVLVAEILEGLTVARGRGAIQDLLNYLPRTAAVRRQGEVRELPLTDVVVGDLVLVNPGGRLPVDGTVVGGHSYVDQATITGESMPVEKIVESQVFAGTINQSGALEVRADRLGRDTSFGKIIEAVESAERSRAPVQKLADRLAGYLVYFAIGAAVLTFIVTRDARSTISVIIVAGACGIAAGTPLAILGGIGRAARQGAIIKGGRYLEALATVDTVVLDKTGTLTFGNPEVRTILAANGVEQATVLDTAAIAERRSEHPVGKAIVARAQALGLPSTEPEEFVSIAGHGVAAIHSGQEILVGSRAFLRDRGFSSTALAVVPTQSDTGASEVLVTRAGKVLGAVHVADSVRPEAKEAMASLKSMGMRVILLTGDQRSVAVQVARELEVDDVSAELLPDAKLKRVEALVAEGRKVAMVGDGVNDAPALAAATVGIAMGSGTDVARESADVVLLGNDLIKFVETLKLARRTRRIIVTNFGGTLVVDGIGIGLAAMGLLNPLLAAFIHVTSELIFILNSARLLPQREIAPSSA